MLATIAAINKFHEDAGITEVNKWEDRFRWVYAHPLVRSLVAEPLEFLYYGWRKRRCDSIYLEPQGRGCISGV